MKRPLRVWSLLSVLALLCTSDQPSRIAHAQSGAAGLVAAYAMDEGAGTALSDWSASGLTGSISGASWTTSGKFGSGALSFDGVNDFVTIDDAAALDLTTGMTLEAWVYPTAAAGTDWRNVLIKERPGGEVYNLYSDTDSHVPTAYVVSAAQSTFAVDVRGTSQVPLNTWTHLAATFDNSTLRLFVNGVQAGTRAIAGPLMTSDGVLRIGGNSIWGEYFQGRLDEVRIYNRALTPAEIQADMNTGIGGPDAVAPVLSGGSPSGVLPMNTTQATLTLVTNESATCRSSVTPGVTYLAMTDQFIATGGVTHARTVTGLTSGTAYTFYVRCADLSNNATTSDYVITFSVAAPGEDSTPPSVSITSPPDGASVSGMLTLIAAASDNVGVSGVRFFVDDFPLGSEVLTPPYTTVWDTSIEAIGPHTLRARVRDTAGNVADSATIAVAVANTPVPPNFVDEIVVGSGITFPTAFEFLPDGRMLVTEFRGRVMVLQPGATVLDTTPVIELPNIFEEDVTVGGERGLVNVVADPDFANNGYFYVFYTAASPQRDRVSRFTMSGNTANPSTEFVVWQGLANSTSTDHHGGGLGFGPDGKLYISTGDNGEPPSSQPLSSDHGKLLRLNKNGTIPSDNPFVDGNGSNVDAIWARGLRNPYRFSWDSLTGKMYIGDVGQNLTEEVNIGTAGANYGWPNCEGSCNTPGMTNPLYTYSHGGRDAAVTGGFVYRGTQFPSAYQGVYFYGDFAQNWIRYLTFNGSGAVTGSQPFLPADGSSDGPYDPIMIKPGPDGSLYYVDFGWGWLSEVNPAAIRRIRYLAGNQAPIVAASATPRTGQAPLSVSFSSAGSFDPEGLPLTYTWTFGDGSSSNAPDPVHVYTTSGLYAATLAISDGTVTSTSSAIGIAVGNPPEQTLSSPVNGTMFRAGDVVTFAATATDPEDGPLPPSAYSWTILFHHESHVHPTFGPSSGLTSGTFTIPTTGHDFSGSTYYEFVLTTTDSTGLQKTSSVSVFPHKVNLTFNTIPAGLTFTIDGVTRTTPYVKDTLTGFQHTIGAPNQVVGSVNYGFLSWSDGGAQTHGIVAGETDTTYNAAFQPTTVTAVPSSAVVLAGTLSSGTVAALAVDDNSYYSVASTTGGTRTAAWYGAFSGVPNSLGNLRVNYRGNNSASCTQTVSIWNWTTSAWAQLDSRSVSTTEVAISNLLPPGAAGDYVSGTAGSGELRVRIQCTSTGNRTSRGDAMSIAYDMPLGPDVTPPTRTAGAPAGMLPIGTTQVTLSLVTDESAVCRYATTPDLPYASMVYLFSSTGGTAHTATATGLSAGGPFSYFVRCLDAIGNSNTDDFVISFSIADDTAPPGRSNGQPSGTLAAGTTQTTLGLSTDEGAVCRYGPVAGTAYGSLPNLFTTTGGTSHSTVVSGLANGTSYSYYVRCQDGVGNANPDDFVISFAVATPPPPDGIAPTATLTAPATGATVAGSVTVTATATDNVGVVGVQFLLNGSPLGTEDLTAPYSIAWNTATVANGPYTLAARARDAIGNTGTSVAVSVTVNNVAATGLVAAYSFNEGSGASAADQTGTGHTGAVSGATWTPQGRFGSALTFDGVNDWVTVADANDLDFTTAFTLEAWVRPTTLGSGAWRNVLIKERGTGESYNLYAHSNTNVPKAYAVRAAAPNSPLEAAGTSALPVNTWSHLTVTYNGSTLRLYVNGVSVGTRAVSGALAASSGALRVGGNSIWGEFFAGQIDEVRLYNRALSATEILTDMEAPVQP